jgi:hypothetical protein
MPPPPEGYSWKSLESAPLDEDITLQVSDGRGKPYILVNASKLTAVGWVSSSKERCWPSRRWRGGDTSPTWPPPPMTSADRAGALAEWAADRGAMASLRTERSRFSVIRPVRRPTIVADQGSG